jgi:hypothetical protein
MAPRKEPPAEKPENDNMALWKRLFKTDPTQTKSFTKGGGFSGTAIKPYWAIMRATEEFGPVGVGWGWDVIEDRVETAQDGSSIWFSKVAVWYMRDGERRIAGPQWGATELVVWRKKGKPDAYLFMDEEAAKKSVTDALTKCLSYLGLGGDVHMGMFDDMKYVNERREEEREERRERARNQAKSEDAEQPSPDAIKWRDAVLKEIHGIIDVEELRGYWAGQLETAKHLSANPGPDKAVANFVKAQVEKRGFELKELSGRKAA